MPRALRPCSTPGCPNLTPAGQSRCDTHNRQADRDRGTARQRGYTTAGHQRFRRRVLARDRLCVLCGAVATVADHYPKSRRDLIAEGLDPNDPAHGRGLCASCHGKETMRHQPGGYTAMND